MRKMNECRNGRRDAKMKDETLSGHEKNTALVATRRPQDFERLGTELERLLGLENVIHVASGQKALEVISRQSINLMVSDHDLGDMGSWDLCAKAADERPDMLLAVVSLLPDANLPHKSHGLAQFRKIPFMPGADCAKSLFEDLRNPKGLRAA